MSSEMHNVVSENGIELTPEKLEEIKSCIHNKEGVQQSLLGMAIGFALTSLPLVLKKPKVKKTTATAFVIVGTVYGYLLSSYMRVKDCVTKVTNDKNVYIMNERTMSTPRDTLGVNVYENRKSRLENEELNGTEVSSKESIFDIDSSPQMNLLDEFPVINESVEVQDNKEPERTLTYKELRERNRESYKSRNIIQKPMWARDQSKEQYMKVKEPERESKEPDFFHEQDTGKRKTKYGDIWD